jgi:hypothetical protein
MNDMMGRRKIGRKDGPKKTLFFVLCTHPIIIITLVMLAKGIGTDLIRPYGPAINEEMEEASN